MQISELIKTLFAGRNTNVFLGISVIVASIFSAYSSRNSVELNRNYTESNKRVLAIEEFIKVDIAEQDRIRDRILILETNFANQNIILGEIKLDVKSLIHNK